MHSLQHKIKSGITHDKVEIRREFKDCISTWREAFEYIDMCRKKRLFCDVTIAAKGVEMVAHKIMLVSQSELFYDLLKEDTRRVDLKKEIDSEALELLIEYIYTFEIPITDKNVNGLLAGSSILGIYPVKAKCCKFLTEQLNVENCFNIQAIAQKHDCEELLKHSRSYAKEHFAQLMDHHQFLTFSPQQLSEFFSKINASNHDEDAKYDSFMKWVKHDLKTRKRHLKSLMKDIQFNLLTRDCLINIVNEPLHKDDLDVKNSIIAALLQKGPTPSHTSSILQN